MFVSASKLFRRHKDLVVYFGFSAAAAALGFFASMAMVRLITPSEFGRIGLFMNVLFFVTPIISFSAENLISIKKSILSQTDYEYFRCNYVSFSYFMFLIVQSISFLFYFLSAQHDGIFLLLPLAALAKFLIIIVSIEYVIEGKSVQYGLVAFSTAVLSFILTLIFLNLFSPTAVWRVTALLLSDAVFLIVRYRSRLRVLLTFNFDRIEYRKIISFGFPLLISVTPAWVLNESDKIIIAYYLDLASAGTYTAACSIGGAFMLTFNSALQNVATPKFFQALGDSTQSNIFVVKKYTVIFMAVSIVFGLLFSLFYHLLSELILPEKYAAGREIVYIIILFSLARSLYTPLGMATEYLGFTKVKSNAIFYASIVSVISTISGVVLYGISGAATGFFFGYMILSFMLWMNLVKESRLKAA